MDKRPDSDEADELRAGHWPHAARAGRDTLDLDRVEQQAVRVLARALRTRRLVAFVGAGASVAYGRLAWAGLMSRLYDAAEVHDAPRWLVIREALWGTNKQSFNDFNEHAIKAQVLAMVRPSLGASSSDAASEGLAEQVKRELQDYRGFVRWLLQQGFGKTAEEAESMLSQSLARLAEVGLSPAGSAHSAQAFGLRGVLQVLASMRMAGAGAGAGAKALRPGAAPADKDLDKIVRALSRQSVDLDSPLRALVRDWDIRRFITTNYDHEIEHGLQAQGFADRLHEDAVHANQFHRTTFSRHDTGEAFRFAFEGPRRHAEILHLHGDVDQPSSLIVTESDYQRLYLDDHPNRDLVTNAALGLFAANPVFFVGSDAGEDDVMRPMRQFMSGDGHRRDRLAVALFPALRSKQHRARQATALLLRYGVLAVHYGWEQAAGANRRGGADGDPAEQTPWLEGLSIAHQKVSALCNSATFDGQWKLALKAVQAIEPPTHLEGEEIEPGSPLDLRGPVEWIRSFAGQMALQTPASADAMVKRFVTSLELVKDWATSAFLCAKLLSLRRAADDCIDDDAQLALPYARPPELESPDRQGLRLLIRHSVVLRHTHFVNRFEHIEPKIPDRKGSQAFDEGIGLLCAAIEETDVGWPDATMPCFPALEDDGGKPGADEAVRKTAAFPFARIRGRRVIVICGSRGHGKGGQSDRLVQREWPQGSAEGEPGPFLTRLAQALGGYLDEGGKRSSVFHVNMSFSNELGPIISQLAGALWQLAQQSTASSPPGETLDQLEALDRSLRQLVPPKGKSDMPRLMVIIGNAGVLFDGSGRPKNGQINRVVRLLMSKRFRTVPLDILMYVGESQMPHELRETKQQDPPLAGGSEPDLQPPAGADARRRRRFDRLNIRVHAPAANPNLIVHALARTRLSELAAAYFPTLAADLGFTEADPAINGGHRYATIGSKNSELAWRLYLATGGSRFAMTVMLALIDTEAGPENAKGMPAHQLAKEFLFSLNGPPSSAAIEKVIEFSLDRWESRHIQGRPLGAAALPGKRTAQKAAVAGVESAESKNDLDRRLWADVLHARMQHLCEHPSRQGWDFAVELLWHLGAFSHPVEAEVLLTCPQVGTALDAMAFPSECWDDRLCWVEAMLELMVHWCLLFRIGPRPIPAKARDGIAAAFPQGARYRYAPHRHMQRHLVRLMGGRNVESTQWDQFTLTTYASLPDEAPILRPAVHRRLTDVVRWLTDYPGQRQRTGPGDSGLGSGTPAEREMREMRATRATRAMVHDADCIRAAYFLVRSTYSLGVVAHLAPESADDAAGCGHMEEYRRQVRWITHAARYWERTHGIGAARDPAKPQAQAWCGEGGKAGGIFYPSELVWLYHECGVISLAQGKLNDAEQLLTLAEQAARRLEADDSGSLHMRIRLHTGLVQLERGRPHRAKLILEPIAARLNGHAVPPLLAGFYLGLVDHIGGNYESAERQYAKALHELRRLKRSRACAFVQIHRANLMQRMNLEPKEKALATADEAISLAQQGGHEDVRHLAILERARILVSAGMAGERRQPGIFEQLNAAERYAVRMDIPRLSCEVHEVRARLLMRQGEYEMSARDAAKSLEIASLYALKLKKARGLLTLAQIYRHRKDLSGARALAVMGRDIANSCDYYTCVRGFKELELSLDMPN